jgi:hypothetical protein
VQYSRTIIIARKARSQLHVSLTHVHCVGRKSRPYDDCFRGIDVQGVVVEISEG